MIWMCLTWLMGRWIGNMLGMIRFVGGIMGYGMFRGGVIRRLG